MADKDDHAARDQLRELKSCAFDAMIQARKWTARADELMRQIERLDSTAETDGK